MNWVFSGIHIGFVSFCQACFGMLVFQHKIQSQLEVEAVGHQAVSLKNHPWQIADNGTADNATWLFTLLLDWMRYQRHKAVPTIFNNQLSWETTPFCSVCNLRKSNVKLLFRHWKKSHPRWDGFVGGVDSILKVRAKFAELIGCHARDVALTPSTSYAMSQARNHVSRVTECNRCISSYPWWCFG